MKFTIIYIDEIGAKQTLTVEMANGESVWTGNDKDVVERLNVAVSYFLGITGYYPTSWHQVKAVADKLGGYVVEPEPDWKSEKPPGAVF